MDEIVISCNSMNDFQWMLIRECGGILRCDYPYATISGALAAADRVLKRKYRAIENHGLGQGHRVIRAKRC